MPSICFYFQVHQPYRLRKYSVFDIGKNSDYFDETKNQAILEKIVNKCYLPTNRILLSHLKQYPAFKISFSFSGVLLDQLEEYFPQALETFQELVDTGKVEILAETYYHSLAFIHSKDEFKDQIKLHGKKIKKLFGFKPKLLRNTELIYNNDLAKTAKEMGYAGVLIEGADKILDWRSPNFIYKPVDVDIPLLLKNYRLSDDIAFRFSERSWKEYPLTADKYAQWVNAINGNGISVNLFMDYETFGEHQWESTGIFEFLRHLPEKLLKHPDNRFKFPSEVITQYKPVGELNVPDFVSWADTERDVSAWLGNGMQQAAIRKLYDLEKSVKASRDKQLLHEWRKLQISDHFYYMCTKWFNDGDVHKYFNPYESPYEGFVYFMNALNDITQRIQARKKGKHAET